MQTGSVEKSEVEERIESDPFSDVAQWKLRGSKSAEFISLSDTPEWHSG